MQRGREERIADKRVTPAATIVKTVAMSMVFFLPRKSKRAPVKILPSPLQTAKTPTREVATETEASTESAKSRAKEITEFPTAVANKISKNALQKVNLLSISLVEKSLASKISSLLFAFFLGAGRLVLSSGRFKKIAPIERTAKRQIPKTKNVQLRSREVLKSESARLPRTRELAPNPIIRAPEQKPFLSGNQALTVEIKTL